MKKFARMEAFVAGLSADPPPALDPSALDPCYAGYFVCFNRGDYYEAHDVLEHLWLRCADANEPFYKGLIQLAGGFVHLRKHFEQPEHPKHGRRLAPASRLFDLAAANLAPFAPRHQHLDVAAALALARNTAHTLRATAFATNPWSPVNRPTMQPNPAPTDIIP